MKKTILLLCLLSLALSGTMLHAQNADGDAIIGLWETGSGKARVNIIKSGNYYYGRIAWLREPLNDEGKPKVDKHNSDESKRTSPLLGLKMLSGFEFKGDKHWEDGTIYDPESGKTYKCVINLADNNNMKIRGYVGITAFGRTDVWKRVESKKK